MNNPIFHSVEPVINTILKLKQQSANVGVICQAFEEFASEAAYLITIIDIPQNKMMYKCYLGKEVDFSFFIFSLQKNMIKYQLSQASF